MWYRKCLILSIQDEMISWREKEGLTLKELSLRSGISSTLLGMIERGGVTHPDIARKVAEAYGLTEEQAYELMPKIHRPNDEKYDPKAYNIEDQVDFRKFKIIPKQLDVTDIYIAEHQKELRRRHAKRGKY